MLSMLFNTMRHVVLFFIVFFMFLFCFAIGIQMTYINYRGMWQITLHPLDNLPDCHTMESSFPDFLETFYMLFWDLFGYGEIQTTQIFLPNLRLPKKNESEADVFLDPADMLKFREMLCVPDLNRSRPA